MGPSSLGRAGCRTSSKQAGLGKCSHVLAVTESSESEDFHQWILILYWPKTLQKMNLNKKRLVNRSVPFLKPRLSKRNSKKEALLKYFRWQTDLALVKNSWTFSFIVSQAFKRVRVVVIGRQKLLTLSSFYKAYSSTCYLSRKTNSMQNCRDH